MYSSSQRAYPLFICNEKFNWHVFTLYIQWIKMCKLLMHEFNRLKCLLVVDIIQSSLESFICDLYLYNFFHNFSQFLTSIMINLSEFQVIIFAFILIIVPIYDHSFSQVQINQPFVNSFPISISTLIYLFCGEFLGFSNINFRSCGCAFYLTITALYSL